MSLDSIFFIKITGSSFADKNNVIKRETHTHFWIMQLGIDIN